MYMSIEITPFDIAGIKSIPAFLNEVYILLLWTYNKNSSMNIFDF